MTDEPQIILTVRADGTATAVTHGMHGETCLDYIAVLEDLLDGTTSQSTFTADYSRVVVHEDALDSLADEVTDR